MRRLSLAIKDQHGEFRQVIVEVPFECIHCGAPMTHHGYEHSRFPFMVDAFGCGEHATFFHDVLQHIIRGRGHIVSDPHNVSGLPTPVCRECKTVCPHAQYQPEFVCWSCRAYPYYRGVADE